MIALREAAPGDAKPIQEIHRDSIQNVAHAFYPSHVIKAWSHNLGTIENIRHHEAAIRSGAERVIVAEIDGKIVGFGAIVPSLGELRAVYVASSVKRSGIGTQILLGLEKLAKSLGVFELHMDASLSAVKFYVARGYRELERKKHILSTGAEMDCVAMQKSLQS